MKLKFAIFEPNINELKKIQAFILSTNFNIEVYRAASLEIANKIINEHSEFDFIYINVEMSSHKKLNDSFLQTTLSKFPKSNFMFLYESDIQKKYLSDISVLEKEYDYDGWMKLPFKPMQFMESLEKKITNIAEYECANTTKEYIALRLVELQHVGNAPCDIYISLREDRYVKIINESEELESAFFEKYREKGVTAFHVKREEFNQKFEQFFSSAFLSKKAFKTEEEYVIKSQRMLSDLIADFGISEYVIDIAKTIADETIKILEKNNLKNILALLKNNKDSFIYDHSFLLSLVCLETAKKFTWFSSKHNRVICLGAMLHDAYLNDSKFNDIEIGGFNDLNSLSEIDKKRYLEHPAKMTEQLKNIMDIPSDVLGIILKHHEGFGPERSFPCGYHSTQLSALECIFVMSHEVINLFYLNNFKLQEIEECLPAFWRILKTDNFKKYVNELEEVVNEILISFKAADQK